MQVGSAAAVLRNNIVAKGGVDFVMKVLEHSSSSIEDYKFTVAPRTRIRAKR
jgi:hypothetical protein